MFLFSVVRESAVIVIILSISYAFSVADSENRWRQMMMMRGTDVGREEMPPASEAAAAAAADELNRSAAVVITDVEEPSIADQSKMKDKDKDFKPEAEYLLKTSQRKWTKDSRKTDFESKNPDSIAKELRLILKKDDKRKPANSHRNKLKYFNSDRFNDGGDSMDDGHQDKKEEKKNEDEDLDDWSSPEQLDRDYVYAARSTSGFLRQARRQAPSASVGGLQVVVDVLVVVDNALYRRALQRSPDHQRAIQEIKRYYGIVISLVDSRYSQIEDNDLNIRIRLAGIHISRVRSDSPWSERNVRTVKHSLALDPNVGLEKFHEWLKEEHLKLPKFDHAMAFTGYSLVTASGKHTSGMAYIGTVCKVSDGYSSSIIQEDGGLSSVSTAVHELGHSLGAKHDGEGSNAVCPVSRNYIMAPGNSAEKELLKNFFVFSPCTIREFKALLSSEDVECLLDSSPDQVSNLPGQEITPDDQCKDVFGQESGSCEIDDSQSSEEICTRLWCVKPGKPDSCITRGHLTAVLGTTCAPGKVCKNGQCLDKARVLESLKGAKSNGNRTMVSVNRVSPATRAHRPHTATEKPVKIELGRPRCREDTGPEYCRTTVYQRPDLCQRSDMAAYCCFSCSFV